MKALRHYTQVAPDGMVTLPKLPFQRGTLVEVIVLPMQEQYREFLQAAASSLDFWDNSIDDGIWKHGRVKPTVRARVRKLLRKVV